MEKDDLMTISGFKRTKVKLSFITDIDMLLIVEKAI